MKIKVRYLPPLSIKLGWEEETLQFNQEKITVNQVLQQLEGRYGEKFRKMIYMDPFIPQTGWKATFLKNGSLAQAEDELEDEDVLILMMGFVGG